MTALLLTCSLLAWWAIICQAQNQTPMPDRVVKLQVLVALLLTSATLVSFLK